MSQMAKSARGALKDKARRLAGESSGKVDATSVKRPAPFGGEKKTGLQPTTRRAFKKGGAVKKQVGGSSSLPNPEEAARSEERLNGVRVESKAGTSRKLPPPGEAAGRSGKTPQDMPARKSGGRNWIKNAIKKPGALHKELGVPEGKNIPEKKLEAAEKKGGKLAKRAQLAETLKGMANKCNGGGMRKKRDLGGVLEAVSPAYALVRAAQRNGKDEERDTANRMQGAAMANANRKSGGRAAKQSGGGTGSTSSRSLLKPSTWGAAGEGSTGKGYSKSDDYHKTAADGASKSSGSGGNSGFKKGGRTAKKGGGGLTVINIGGKGGQPQPGAMPPSMGAPPVAAPPPMAPPMAPPPAPVAGNQAPMQKPAGFNKGGRISKVASSYKNMKASSAGGLGRLEKTSIASKGKGAPKA